MSVLLIALLVALVFLTLGAAELSSLGFLHFIHEQKRSTLIRAGR